MPDEFVIKQETFPARCEICHQADFFDPKTNHCARCNQNFQRFPPRQLVETKKQYSSSAKDLVWLLTVPGALLIGLLMLGEAYDQGGPCNGGLIFIPLLGLWILSIPIWIIVYGVWRAYHPE
ncbi:MAG: hypothetical protein HY774_07925 [Acidobacteria bacterium]|nr:hypothetical protein [Acidobacteriota bacterium]